MINLITVSELGFHIMGALENSFFVFLLGGGEYMDHSLLRKESKKEVKVV